MRSFVALWVALGLLASGAVLTSFPPRWPVQAEGGWLALAAAVVLLTAALRTEFVIRHGRGELSTSPIEAAAIFTFLVLPGSWPVLAMAAATLLDSIGRPRPLIRRVFNTAQHLAAAGTALLIYRSFQAGDPFSIASLGLAFVVLLIYTVMNWGAVAGVLARQTGATSTQVMRTATPAAFGLFAGTAAMGIVAAKLWMVSPQLLPLLAIPIVTISRGLEARYEQFEQMRRERDRLDRLVAGANDGIALLDDRGHVEVWNRALADLTGIPAHQALGRHLDALLEGHDTQGERVRVTAVARQAQPDAPVREIELTLPNDERGARFVRLSQTVLFEADGTRAGNVVIVRDLTAQHEIESIKQDLVQRISHELRTPLTTLLGFVETLRQRWSALDEEEAERYLDVMGRNATRLETLVSGLLVKSRVERAVPRPAPVEVGPLLHEAAGTEPGDRSGPIHVFVEGDPVAHADPGHVRQILDNYVSNARTYGAEPITVSASTHGSSVRICVRDEGPGVPAEFEDELFRAFTQASTGTTRTARGLGVGLSLVASLASANHGRAWYQRGPTSGASFLVDLPAWRDDHQGAV